MMYRKLSNEKGSALAMVMMVMLILSILGTTILSLASSENNFTRIDSLGQSAYYVAESGIHYIQNDIKEKIESVYESLPSKDDFFRAFESDYKDKSFVFDSFEINQGEQPRADIRVERVGSAENSRDYRIESTGRIGKSKRTVSSVITLSWSSESTGPADLLLRTLSFTFQGPSFNAPGDKTIVISGHNLGGHSQINVKNIYFKFKKINGKSWESGISSGRTYGKEDDPGDIYLHREDEDLSNFYLDDGRYMYGNVHTNRDFTVSGGAHVYGNLYVDGKLKVDDGSFIHGDVYVAEDFELTEGAIVEGNVYVFGEFYAGDGGIIEGNLNVDGDAKLQSVTIGGEANIKGNLDFDWTPSINIVRYTGSIKAPDDFHQDILDKCKKLGENEHPFNQFSKLKPDFRFSVPECVASLKDDVWYTAHGYERKGHVSGKVTSGSKWYVDSFESTEWQGEHLSDVIIVSKGDINVKEVGTFTGALIAPDGVVNFTGSDFKGIIISNKEIRISGWGKVDIQDLVEFFGEGNIPFNVSCRGGSGSGSGGGKSNTIFMFTKQSIKEK